MTALIAMITLFLWLNSELSQSRALRLAAFNVVSIVTGTGYATVDYNAWGPFAVSAFFAFMFIGGCAGSTACSVKIFRYQVAFEGLRAYLFKMPRQHAVAPMRYGGKPLPESVVFSVMGYFFLFFMTFAIVAILLSIMGLDPLTAWSGAGSAVANVGPGLGDIIGPRRHLSKPAQRPEMGVDDSHDCRKARNRDGVSRPNPGFLAGLKLGQRKHVIGIAKLAIGFDDAVFCHVFQCGFVKRL